MFLKVTKRKMAGGSSTHPVMVRRLLVWAFVDCESSPQSLWRGQSPATPELMQYEGNRFVPVNHKVNSQVANACTNILCGQKVFFFFFFF